jgi:hypothetical protein
MVFQLIVVDLCISVSLTKTKKKGLGFKQQLVDDIRRCVEDYKRIFVFSVQNMRNAKLKDLRTEWRHSRYAFLFPFVLSQLQIVVIVFRMMF